MLHWLTDPFAGGIARRALAEVLLLAVACGPLGVWVLLHHQSYAAESLSHGMLPGLVLAALAGAPLLLGAAGGVLVAAGGIALAGRDARLGSEVGVAVAVSTLLGAGAMLALSPASPPRIEELLFGDLLGVGTGDLLAGGALAAGVVAALTLGHRALALTAFEPGAAAALGTRPARVELGLLVLLGATTVAAVQGLGSLLLVALVLAPGAAALQRARSLHGAMAAAAGLAALAGVAGLVASYHLRVAAGASVALAALALPAAAALVPRPGS